MAPGSIKGFGLDKAGLKQLQVPTYIIAGEKDSVVPIKDNAQFAAKYIPHVKLYIIPGEVGHEIFVNACDAECMHEFPGTCINAEGIDRQKIHALVENEALKFFDANLGVRRE